MIDQAIYLSRYHRGKGSSQETKKVSLYTRPADSIVAGAGNCRGCRGRWLANWHCLCMQLLAPQPFIHAHGLHTISAFITFNLHLAITIGAMTPHDDCTACKVPNPVDFLLRAHSVCGLPEQQTQQARMIDENSTIGSGRSRERDNVRCSRGYRRHSPLSPCF
jgi:hypothetical protein